MLRNLKNCPFCGSTMVKLRKKNRTVINGNTERNTYCYCTVCDVRGTRILYRDYEFPKEAEDKAIELWNRRADDDNMQR
jgi:Lar family restriction alleviation protein